MTVFASMCGCEQVIKRRPIYSCQDRSITFCLQHRTETHEKPKEADEDAKQDSRVYDSRQRDGDPGKGGDHLDLLHSRPQKKRNGIYLVLEFIEKDADAENLFPANVNNET